MINLLPGDVKKEIGYGRKNKRMLLWLTGLGVFLILMLCVTGLGYLYNKDYIAKETARVTVAQQRKAELKLQDTQKQFDSLSNQLKLVNKVLSENVLFSKLATQIGSTLPRGVVLTKFDLADVEGGIDISASTTDYQSATQFQLNLQDKNNQLFEKADIVKIDCNNEPSQSSEDDSPYPCTATYRALFGENSSKYRFASLQEQLP